jgi:hypothetical protein
MKLLGKYESELATKYKDILSDYSIEAKVDFDPENLPQSMATGLSRGLFAEGIALMCVYVPEDSYDKAVKIIRDYETQKLSTQKKNIRPIILIVAIVVVLVIFVGFLFFYGAH